MNKVKAGPQYVVIESYWGSDDTAKRSIIDGVVRFSSDTYQAAHMQMKKLAEDAENFTEIGSGVMFVMAQVLFAQQIENEVTHTEVDYRQI